MFKETWGPLFPIHIVSVFHNYEILRELIQLGVDVNQWTEDGWTALSLAIERITEERKENNCNISKKTRCYQTLHLLLCNGMEQTLIYVINLGIVLFIQLVKLDRIALSNFY